MDPIAKNIKIARLQAGYLRQDRFADAVGMPQSAISRYETGKLIPSISTLRRIAATLKNDAIRIGSVE